MNARIHGQATKSGRGQPHSPRRWRVIVKRIETPQGFGARLSSAALHGSILQTLSKVIKFVGSMPLLFADRILLTSAPTMNTISQTRSQRRSAAFTPLHCAHLRQPGNTLTRSATEW